MNWRFWTRVAPLVPVAFPRDDRMVKVIQAHRGEPLAQFFCALIAARDDVPVEEVTLDYIREQREKRVYPTARYEVHSTYGGAQQHDLRQLTRQEVEKILAAND